MICIKIAIFIHAGNWNFLVQPRLTTSTQSSILTDIWDGAGFRINTNYKNFFSLPGRIAVSMCTDGIPLFKSSSVTLWPIYLVLLNLSANIRMNAENVILCGLWVGPVKPSMSELLKPVVAKVQQFFSKGLTIETPNGVVTIYLRLVLGVFDLPAKAAVLCSKQFNGKFGCSVCLNPGKQISKGLRVFLFDRVYAERTHEGVVKAAYKAIRTQSCVKGIRNLSPLAGVIDLVNGVPVDYMHAVLEGVVRLLLNLWFNSTQHREAYYLRGQLTNIDNNLKKQRPPSEFSRPPRSIKKHLKYLKASELRTWLLYYSLPLLLHELPSLYWHHYALLVCSIHVLLGEKITYSNLQSAEQMLCDFCGLFSELYGERNCTHNFHLLTHLCKYVKLWGPLWTHSAFGFENKNGHLKQLFHGKDNVVDQLLFNVDVRLTLQLLYPCIEQTENDRTMNYINSLKSPTYHKSKMIAIGLHTYVLGAVKLLSPSTEQMEAIHHSGPIESFTCLLKNNIHYSVVSYRSGSLKRDDSICVFQDQHSIKYAEIELFVMKPMQCALVRELMPLATSIMDQAGPTCRTVLTTHRNSGLLNSYIIPISHSSSTLASIPLKNIISKPVVIVTGSCKYVIMQPNQYEHH